jgi:murein DD-endopeptidase MepM/ murein hydrolase activator NlpD
MAKEKRKRRRTKNLTITLAPDSMTKIRNIRIPYRSFIFLVLPLVFIVLFVALHISRVSDLENRLNISSENQVRMMDEISKLEGELADAVNMANEDSSVEDELSPETIAYLERIDAFEQKMEELLVQIGIIDEHKQIIFSIFEEIIELDIPLSFDLDEILLSGGEFTAGELNYPEEADHILSELYLLLSGGILEVQAMAAFSELLDMYFKARPFGWPVDEGDITSGFGQRVDVITGEGMERHTGVDISARSGTEVRATADGVVRVSSRDDNGYGQFVVIDHGFGYSTLYAHNSRLLVLEGDEVKRGQVIAISGNTGRSTSPHLHYEVRIDGVHQNPRGFLPNNGNRVVEE